MIINENQKDPFDIEVYGTVYSVFPEEDASYTIFKNGEEYLHIVKDSESDWIKLDMETSMPLFGIDEEVNLLGRKILEYEKENND
ncbi:MAG TPA: hypothetical protein VK076_04005 [Candidatus Sphingobacterium stercoripullorum]|uniref:Uncharacterized protein n=1 Tax=Candidatus Sphingobacterium stercoripullorum TaxID=2838759 RepID=A0A9D1W7J2_9SPHI|nr:hypothetical protein [Candidatus Sphingobacterium stercoripullorum]HLR49716.1 hypothetical protein [Candidatus Sphingobacterium stercoripullorum]